MTAAALVESLTPEWHEARRRGVSASEIAAVMGISPWESPFSLYWRKVHGWSAEDSDEMEWGRRLEDVIAAKYTADHDELHVGRGGLVTGPEPWMLATPDRLIYEHEDRPFRLRGPIAVLEVKTAHSAHDGWGEPGTDEIPVHYRAQVQWQMLAANVDEAAVAVLAGGSDYREYTVHRDERDIAVMVERGRRFMARLAVGEAPPVDEHTATIATLRRLHPDLDDETVDVPDDVADSYLRAVAMYRRSERLKHRYEAKLRDHMGSAKRARSAAGPVATRVVSDIAESTRTVPAHRRDYLLPPRERKS